MSDCIFCKIVSGELPSHKLIENDHLIVIRDKFPQARVHCLIIPRQHVANLNDLKDPALSAELLQIARQVAELEGVAQAGYRVVMNTNKEGGQSVYHLHVHVLGGQQLGPSMIG